MMRTLTGRRARFWTGLLQLLSKAAHALTAHTPRHVVRHAYQPPLSEHQAPGSCLLCQSRTRQARLWRTQELRCLHCFLRELAPLKGQAGKVWGSQCRDSWHMPGCTARSVHVNRAHHPDGMQHAHASPRRYSANCLCAALVLVEVADPLQMLTACKMLDRCRTCKVQAKEQHHLPHGAADHRG